MTTKQYLIQGKEKERQLQQQVRVLGRLHKMSASDKGEKVAFPQLQAEIGKELEELLAHRRELGTLIAQLPDQNHRGLLTMRYLCGLRWEQIARRMHYSSRHVHRMHIQALEALEQCRKSNVWS